MSLRLRPYPEMKDSGVPWLGKSPRIGKSGGSGTQYTCW